MIFVVIGSNISVMGAEVFSDRIKFFQRRYTIFPATERVRSSYLALRQDSRNLLSRAGIRSNPGWLDSDIVSNLRNHVGLSPVESWDQTYANDRSFEDFRDRMIATIQEAGVEIAEPMTEVPHVIEALEVLLIRKAWSYL